MDINKAKVKRFREIVNELADLYEKKNQNYGDSFGQLYRTLGPVSGLVPLHNKLDRLTNLIKGDKNHFESIEDNFRDLANYSIMNLIEMEYSRKDNQTGWWNDTTASCKTYVYSDDCADKTNNYVNAINVDCTEPTSTTSNLYKVNSSSDASTCISMEEFWNDIKLSLEKKSEEEEVEYSNEH